MHLLKRIILFVLSAAILAYVIIFTPSPSSWTQASYFQILSFFLPLLASLTFLTNIFLNLLPRSFAIGLGGMTLVVLESVNKLNFITVPIVIVGSFLLAQLFHRTRKKPKKDADIPKLTKYERRQLKEHLRWNQAILDVEYSKRWQF